MQPQLQGAIALNAVVSSVQQSAKTAGWGECQTQERLYTQQQRLQELECQKRLLKTQISNALQ